MVPGFDFITKEEITKDVEHNEVSFDVEMGGNLPGGRETLELPNNEFDDKGHRMSLGFGQS